MCRMILRHADGRVEETDVRGEGPILVDSYWKLPPHGDGWWKVVSLRGGAEGGGVADLEPTTLPAHLSAVDET
jgi:hypothetical protein